MANSETPLPIIDISSYLSSSTFTWPPTAAQRACSQSIHAACLEHGFFYLSNLDSIISTTQFQDILSYARRFFDLPQEQKNRLSISNNANGTDGARGYQKVLENVTQNKKDFHEGLDFYVPVTPDSSKPLHGINQYPSQEELPDFKPVLDDWIERCLKVGRALVLATAVGLEMDEQEVEDLMAMVDDSFWVLRCIGYPPLPDTHDGVSCGAHKDYGCYTLLHSTSQPNSLQVFDTTTKEWLKVSPIPDTFIVNIGEMWEIWTNGLYRSTLHRVVHKSDSYRVSIPFFFEPNWEAEVRPLDAAIRIQERLDAATPPLKKSVVYGDFLTKKVAGNFSVDGKKASRY